MRRTLLTLVGLLAGLLAVPLTGQTAPAAPAAAGSDRLVVEVLSNRRDLVSGGDALVEVVLPRRADPRDVTVRLNGEDVTGRFAERRDGRFYGLVTGLRLGGNRIRATAPGYDAGRTRIVNHRNGGPVFSGPQLEHYR